MAKTKKALLQLLEESTPVELEEESSLVAEEKQELAVLHYYPYGHAKHGKPCWIRGYYEFDRVNKKRARIGFVWLGKQRKSDSPIFDGLWSMCQHPLHEAKTIEDVINDGKELVEFEQVYKTYRSVQPGVIELNVEVESEIEDLMLGIEYDGTES